MDDLKMPDFLCAKFLSIAKLRIAKFKSPFNLLQFITAIPIRQPFIPIKFCISQNIRFKF